LELLVGDQQGPKLKPPARAGSVHPEIGRTALSIQRMKLLGQSKGGRNRTSTFWIRWPSHEETWIRLEDEKPKDRDSTAATQYSAPRIRRFLTCKALAPAPDHSSVGVSLLASRLASCTTGT